MLTPVAIFTYNRPRHARQLFISLLNCARLKECSVYIFCDGVKKPEHTADVLNSRQVVHEFAPLLNNARVIEREHNMGVDHSIVSGVTELTAQYGCVIVLEDDLILHPAFIHFMLESLDRYLEDDHVAQIAGFTFPIELSQTSDAFFLPLTTSWGWATWQRAWKLFSWDIELALAELGADPRLSARFALDGTYPYNEVLQNTARDKTDIWDIRYYWHTFHQGKLTLYPRRSLVWQNGFDEFATHTTTARTDLQMPIDKFLQEEWHSPISFPELVQSDEVAFRKLKNFLRRDPSRSVSARLKKILKRVSAQLIK